MRNRSEADVWLDRIVLGALAAVVIFGGAGFTLLAALDKQIPPALAAMVGTASGVLLGWFGRERATRNGDWGGHDGPGPPASWQPDETWPRGSHRKGKN